jgi:uncharacterized protein GlcG (DUF336 family)
MRFLTLTVVAAALLCPTLSHAQAPMSYGSPITVEMAKKAAAPAIAEARKNNWTMAVAIVDPAGDLVYFERMDDVQMGSVDVAIAKARSAARFKRPTKAFQETLAAGGDGVAVVLRATALALGARLGWDADEVASFAAKLAGRPWPELEPPELLELLLDPHEASAPLST